VTADSLLSAFVTQGINWSGLPIFFGLVTSSFEGIGLVRLLS
jgi:hypothetical protein